MWQSIKKAAIAVVIVSLLIPVASSMASETSSSTNPRPTLNLLQIPQPLDGLALMQQVGERKHIQYLRKVRNHYRAYLRKLAQEAAAKRAVEQAAAQQAATVASVGTGTLAAIAQCESGGNPAAVDASGTYRGMYQFDAGTWASVGGSGDPAAASAEEQTRRAATLYARSGSSPWPVCGR
jgi:hypothetical protein